jgi:Protein of unknown function (DUF2530)
MTRREHRGDGAGAPRRRGGSTPATRRDGDLTWAWTPAGQAGSRSANLASMARPQRPAPPPLEGNDQVVILAVMAGWAIALIAVILRRHSLPAANHWWIWTCAVGFGLGVFALWYVPRLKRSRARAAERREAARNEAGRPAEQRTASGGPSGDAA